MARTVRDASLATRAARSALPARKKPYYRLIDQGSHLGYYKGARGGSWLARRFIGANRYEEKKLGVADDVRDADGIAVLSFAQAQAMARAWFSSAAAAELAVEERELRVAAGLPAEPEATGPYTVRQAIEDYLLAYTAGHTKGGGKGLADARSRIDAFILPQLGNRLVSSLSAQDIRTWHAALATAPARVRTRKGETQRIKTIDAGDPDRIRKRRSTANRVLTILKAALNHAFAENKVASDAAWRRVKPFREADAAKIRYHTADEARRLVNAAPPDFRRLVQAALVTGCRYGELTALRVRDFDSSAGTVTIRTSKSASARHVILTDDGIALFRSWTVGRDANAFLLTHANGGPWKKSHQLRPIREASIAARISPATSFHILRHTYATMLVTAGVPLQLVAANLGHADTRMTERHYAHLAPSHIADVIRARAPNLGLAEASNVVSLAEAEVR